MEPSSRSRRQFLQAAAVTTLAAPAQALLAQTPATDGDAKCKKFPASERLGIATIGIGGQGTSDTRRRSRRPASSWWPSPTSTTAG